MTLTGGVYIRQTFWDESGSSDHPEAQHLTGGYLTLIPTTGLYQRGAPWASPTGWDLESSMDSSGDVTGEFVLTETQGPNENGAWEFGSGAYMEYTGWPNPSYFTLQADFAPAPGAGPFSFPSIDRPAPGILVGGVSGGEFFAFYSGGLIATYNNQPLYIQTPGPIRFVGTPEKLYALSPSATYEVPPVSGISGLKIGDLSGAVSGFALDNLKFTTGQAVLQYSAEGPLYPTGAFTWTTESWRPRADAWVIGGGIGYQYHDHGSTEVLFQRGRTGSWTDVTGIYLTGTEGYVAVSLTGFQTGDSIRAQITQSGSGSLPSEPAYLEFQANSDPWFVSFSPSVWPDAHIQRVVATIAANKYRSEAALVDSYDELYLYAPRSTGAATGITDLSQHSRTGTWIGTGVYSSSLQDGLGYRNYVLGTGDFFNPWLNPPFYSVSGSSATGQLPTGFYEPSHTGFITYEMLAAFRPQQIAEAGYSGTLHGSTPQPTGYLLRITTISGASSVGHGVEYQVSAASGLTELTFVTRSLSGTPSLKVWASGAGSLDTAVYGGTGGFSLNKLYVQTTTGTLYVGIGTNTTTTGVFELAEVHARPITTGYVEVESYEGTVFQTGSGTGSFPHRAGTTLGGLFTVHGVVSGEGVLLQKGATSITVDTEGTVRATFEAASDAYGSTVTQGPYTLTGQLGFDELTHVALVHQLSCWPDRNGVGTTGTYNHFARTNKVFLAINGQVHDRVDLASDWASYGAPYVSYLQDTTGSLVIGSGVACDFDAVRHRRAPSESLEAALAKDSLAIAPRGIKMHCPAPGRSGVQTSVALESPYNSVSIWNFGEDDGPAGFDKGWAGNHTTLYGPCEHHREQIPYVRFPSGAYAYAPYDSSLDCMLSFGTGLVIAGRFSGSGTILDWSGQLVIYSDSQYLYVSGSAGVLSGAMISGWNSFQYGNISTGVLYVNTGAYELGAPITGLSGAPMFFGTTGDVSISYVSISVPTGYVWPVDTYLLYPERPVSDSYGGAWIEGSGITFPAHWQGSYQAYFDASGLAVGKHDVGLAFMGFEDDEFPGVMGFRFYPYQRAFVYPDIHYEYPTSGLGIDGKPSAFRLLSTLPPDTVGIARYEVPELSMRETLSLIDLADELPENVAAASRLSYPVIGGEAMSNSVSGASGVFDVLFSGALVSDAYLATSLANRQSTVASPCFYIYPLGTEQLYFYAAGANPHSTVSGDPTKYVENLQLARSLIKLQFADGGEVSVDEFPWDVWLSPYHTAPTGSIFGESGLESGKYLPDGMFSAFIVSERPAVPDKTIFIQYPARTWTGLAFVPSQKEVYKPIRLMGQGARSLGMYDIQLSNDGSLYNLWIYGVDDAYSGEF